jgi:tetratricopeptide (TPR) repeat protein
MIYEPTPATEAVDSAVVPDQAAAARPGPFSLAAWHQREGSRSFSRGLAAYRNRSLSEALSQFELAAEAEPSNAFYQYHRALALYELAGAEAANKALDEAVASELREPVESWGQQMERVQGPARVWVEKARRKAGLVR